MVDFWPTAAAIAHAVYLCAKMDVGLDLFMGGIGLSWMKFSVSFSSCGK